MPEHDPYKPLIKENGKYLDEMLEAAKFDSINPLTTIHGNTNKKTHNKRETILNKLYPKK